MNRLSFIIGSLLLLLLLMLAGCTPGDAAAPAPSPTVGVDPEPPVVPGTLDVERVDVWLRGSVPLQVDAHVTGQFSDGCTTISEVTQTFDPGTNTFNLEFLTTRPADAECTQALVPFEEVVSLEVLGLPAGDYTVNAQGTLATLTLDEDNVKPPIVGLADVNTVEVKLESFPVLARVTARGTLPDRCTGIDLIESEYDATTQIFTVQIVTSRPADAECAPDPRPFDETEPLKVEGLAAGNYTVIVNGERETFTLDDTSDSTEEPPVTANDMGTVPLSGMDLVVLGGFPLEASVIAMGSLPDGCTVLGPIEQGRDVDARRLWVEIHMSRNGGTDCPLSPVPFEETITLDLADLPAGEYTVDVNGIAGSIVLSRDNVAP